MTIACVLRLDHGCGQDTRAEPWKGRAAVLRSMGIAVDASGRRPASIATAVARDHD